MKEKDIRQLFSDARAELAPVPAPNFETNVMRAVGREPMGQGTSLFELFSTLVPRLAAGAAIVIGLCVATDFCLSNFVQADLTSGLSQLAEQWLFAAK